MSIRKASVVRVANNEAKMQTLDVIGIAEESVTNIDKFQQFGFSSNPSNISPNGQSAETILIDLDSASLPVCIATDDRRYRPIVGNTGDVILYSIHDTPSATHDESTQRIVFTDDGTENFRFILKVANTKIEVKSDNSVILNNGNASIQMLSDGTININGNVNFTGTVKANGKVIDDTHTHKSVQPGSGTSGSVS